MSDLIDWVYVPGHYDSFHTWIPAQYIWVGGIVSPTPPPNSIPLPAESGPYAEFVYAVFANQIVEFHNKSQEAMSYYWSFGDGVTSRETNPVHAYGSCGTYEVTLIARNSGGDTVYSHSVVVSQVTAAADYTISGGQSATFTYTGSSLAATYLWDFGDDTTSTAVRPTHNYAEIGSYETSLTITEQITGHTYSADKSLTIAPADGLAFVADHDSPASLNDLSLSDYYNGRRYFAPSQSFADDPAEVRVYNAEGSLVESFVLQENVWIKGVAANANGIFIATLSSNRLVSKLRRFNFSFVEQESLDLSTHWSGHYLQDMKADVGKIYCGWHSRLT